MPALTVSGNEVTDAVRAADALLGIAASGNICDGRAVPGGFGIRRAATNLFRRGQCDAITDWNPNGTGTESRALDATVTPPFSTQSIKATTGAVASGEGIDAYTNTGLAAAAGVVAAGSVYFKGVAGAAYQCFVAWGNTDASFTVGTQMNFTATGSWQLLTPPSVAVAVGKTGDRILLRVATNTNRAESFWLAHAMLESGKSIVSPYVATSAGATATHAAGRVRASSSLLQASQGWFAMRIRLGFSQADQVSSGSFRQFALWGDGGTNVISLTMRSSSPFWKLQYVAGAVNVNTAVAGPAWAAGNAVTAVGYWTPTTLGVSVNGAAFTTAAKAAGTVALAATFDLGSDGGSQQMDSDALWFACGTGTLTNADAALLAALADHDPSFAALPSAAQASAAWPADTSTYEIPLALAAAPVLS